MNFFRSNEPYKGRLSYQNPVQKMIAPKATLLAKDYLSTISDTDLSDTRMLNSTCTLFDSRYAIYDDALFLPYLENQHIPESRFFEHWAYDNKLNPITIANHYKPVLRGYRDHSLIPEYPFNRAVHQEVKAGQYYYMGMLNTHYGHFIQEAITRFWLALEKPNFLGNDIKFVFHPFANAPRNLLDIIFSSGLGDFLKALGITKNNIVLVDKPLLFESIIIPEPSIAISDGDCVMSDKARTVWKAVNGVMGVHDDTTPIRIYLSRAAVNNPIQGRQLLNENEVESYFKKLGYDIVVPEHLTQKQMQEKLKKATTIVGNPGSGLQNSFFIPKSAATLGLTCKPIIKINPGLNHQIHTDIICGHKTYAYCAESYDVGPKHIHWNIDLKDLNQRLERFAPEFLE